MQKIKEVLITTLGAFGHLLFLVLNALLMLINMLPLFILDAPIWLIIIVGIVIDLFPILQLPYLGIWIWAFVVALHQPVYWLTIIFYIAFAIYFGNMLLTLLSSRRQ